MSQQMLQELREKLSQQRGQPPSDTAQLQQTDRPGTLVEPLDYDGATLYMTCHSVGEYTHRLHACAKEPWTVAWIESMEPGSVMYDVGASTGPYSLVAGSRGVRVFAFEPGYASFPSLVDHASMNHLSRMVTCLPIALSCRTGLGLMNYATRMSGGSGHTFCALHGEREVVHSKPVFQQYVMSYRMDDLVAYDPAVILPPNYIKLDVDGAEGFVLQGASKTIAAPSFRSLMLELTGPQAEGLLKITEELDLEMVERFEGDCSDWTNIRGQKSNVSYGLFARRS